MTSMAMQSAQQQQHALSPRLQHAVRLLQLSSVEFAQEVRDALGRNPFLEGDDEGDGDAASPPAEAADLQVDADRPGFDDAVSASAEGVREGIQEGVGITDQEAWQADGIWSSSRHDRVGDVGALDLMASSARLVDHLQLQLNVLPLPLRDLALAKAVAEALDEDGYLRVPLSDVVSPGDLEPPPSEAELAIAIRRVQALDPAGVGARCVAECLLLQLSAFDDDGQRVLARRIIAEHLDLLAAKDLPGLADTCGCSLAEAVDACDGIRHLDPRPGWRYSSEPVRYITPDVILRKSGGQWMVSLNPAIAPRVRVNEHYADLFLQHRSSRQHAALSAQLQEARWTLRNIEQRFATILGVAQEIVRRQRHFFDYGPMAMKPMGLREVADALEMHESTVSRVTNNKFIATPHGVFELKFFFSRAMCTQAGQSCSGTALRGLIKQMIQAESSDAPLSDPEIARRLMRQGLAVARRTVTKYRQQLKIEPVDRRRRFA